MRCYKVTGGGLARFAATQAEAKAAKADVAEATGLKPKEVIVEQTDVPTDKPSLLAFINSLVSQTASQQKAVAQEEGEDDAEEESSADTRPAKRRRRRRD